MLESLVVRCVHCDGDVAWLRKYVRNMLRINWLLINHLLHLVGLTFIYLCVRKFSYPEEPLFCSNYFTNTEENIPYEVVIDVFYDAVIVSYCAAGVAK
jgi:hypothetical protein